MTKQKRQKHTKEFKEESVKLITIQGYSVVEAARNQTRFHFFSERYF